MRRSVRCLSQNTMRNTLTIAAKELQGYFVQPVAYVVLTVFLLLAGWFFFALLRQFDEMIQLVVMMGQSDQLAQMNLNTRVIDPLLHDLSIVLVIVMPALTMRIFAEEKRTGTYELLLTAPVRTGEIVAGKFLAASAFTLIMVALAWIFPLILIVFGNPEVGVMFSGYLGLLLLALSFVAVGLFTSSVTQNQIIAAISSFGLLILLFVISWPADTGGSIVWSVLKYLSLPDHFSTMVRGVIDTTDLIFFLSVILVALFLTQRSVESARWR
jgi:ABC-2 type transport system permease protein